ncbi:MAG: hypothetical protein J7485_00765 [Sphingobium sp.]|nr:hypothetical protein [Sphingobium sp.]
MFWASIMFGMMGMFMLALCLSSLKTGRVFYNRERKPGSAIVREYQPVLFWSVLGVHFCIAAAILGWAVYHFPYAAIGNLHW